MKEEEPQIFNRVTKHVADNKPSDIPMGISKWVEHGMKYGYWKVCECGEMKDYVMHMDEKQMDYEMEEEEDKPSELPSARIGKFMSEQNTQDSDDYYEAEHTALINILDEFAQTISDMQLTINMMKIDIRGLQEDIKTLKGFEK